MYVILVYDVGEERVGRACKLCRRYLNWVQNSVFEGVLTESKLERLKSELSKSIDKEKDSVLIYRFRDQKLAVKEVIGLERLSTDNIV